MQAQLQTIDTEVHTQITKNSHAKKSLLLPKIIFTPRNTNDVAHILRTSPDASTKRDAMQKLNPFEMTKPKGSQTHKGSKQTIFSQIKKAKKPAFFSNRTIETEKSGKSGKAASQPTAVGVEESISQTITSELLEASKYDLKVEEDPLESEERPLEVKGISSTSTNSPKEKKNNNFNFDEKKKSKDNIQVNIYERVLAQKNKPPQDEYNDKKLSTSASANNSGIAVIPLTPNKFRNPSKPQRLMIETLDARPDIDKLPPFEETTKAFSKYSHLLNLANPQQVNRILVERARTMKASSLARSTLDPTPLYSNSSPISNLIDRQSIQKSLQRNQIKSYVTHATYDRRTSENEIIKVVSKLDSHKIELPSSRGKPTHQSEPKILPPIIIPSMATSDAAEENLLLSFKYIPVVKYATKKNKFTNITRQNGISPRRRLQIELDKKEFLINQYEKYNKSRSPKREGAVVPTQEDEHEDEDYMDSVMEKQEEMYKRAMMMTEGEKITIEKIADEIAQSARYKL